LYDAYPNPFNPSATIGYRLNKKGYVRLVVYNIQGQLVKTLVDEQKEAGTYEIKFTAHNQRGNGLASGIYIYKLDVYNSNNIPVYNSMKKMILVK
jgi:flagellar hook assembly protein FlgD